MPLDSQSKFKLPNTFIVGAPKCGTSAMAAYLNHHPNVFLCEPKEPFYWCQDYPLLQKIHEVTSHQRYLDLFKNATNTHTTICEGSTNYLASEVAIQRITEFNPEAKFLVMLRNPVDVVHAFHSELLFSYFEDEPDFEKAWRLQNKRLAGRSLPKNCPAPQFLQYGGVASYAPQLMRFFKLVPKSQRKVIIFDDFANDNAGTFRDTLQFLGLSNFQKESFERVNASHGHKFPLFSELILNPPPALKPFIESARFAARRFKGGWVDQAKHWFRKPTKRQPLRAQFREELCCYFADDVAKTSELLGRELGHWITDAPSKKSSSPPIERDSVSSYCKAAVKIAD